MPALQALIVTGFHTSHPHLFTASLSLVYNRTWKPRASSASATPWQYVLARLGLSMTTTWPAKPSGIQIQCVHECSPQQTLACSRALRKPIRSHAYSANTEFFFRAIKYFFNIRRIQTTENLRWQIHKRNMTAQWYKPPSPIDQGVSAKHQFSGCEIR